MQVTRTNIVIKPDAKRVLLRPFDLNNRRRVANVVGRVTTLSTQEVTLGLERVLSLFKRRHKNVEHRLRSRFDEVVYSTRVEVALSEEHKMLIGSYFCMEYSVESAALFNPSMVWHPDQSGVDTGSRRFILALRATGEGHISSIEF